MAVPNDLADRRGQSPLKNEIMAWVEINRKSPLLAIEARVHNRSGKERKVDYILKTFKEGISGRSNSVQKGRCRLPALDTVIVSHARLRIGPMDRLEISIKILQENKIIAQDSVVFHGDIH